VGFTTPPWKTIVTKPSKGRPNPTPGCSAEEEEEKETEYLMMADDPKHVLMYI
jgi:hypothetical protein